MAYDVFISYAHSDKAEIARPLAHALRAKGCRVWFDEFCIQLGDSIPECIENGLRTCQFGVLICSPAYFRKPSWSQSEMEAFLSLAADGKGLIPIIHNLSYRELKAFSPLLGQYLGLPASIGFERLGQLIYERIRGGIQGQARERTRISAFGVIDRKFCQVYTPHVGKVYLQPMIFSGHPLDDSACPEDDDAGPYASPGDTMSPDTIIAMLGAMGFGLEIRALAQGRFRRYLVKNGDWVDFQQPIAEIDITEGFMGT